MVKTGCGRRLKMTSVCCLLAGAGACVLMMVIQHSLLPRGVAMTQNSLNAFTPQYHKGDMWKVEYLLSMTSAGADPTPAQVTEIWNYEVLGEEMRGIQPVTKIKISSRNLPFYYWLYLTKPQVTLYAIEYVEGDIKWEEDNNGGLISGFLRFNTGDRLLFDWAYFSSQTENDVRNIMHPRNWPFSQEITFDHRSQSMHILLAGKLNDNILECEQTWIGLQPWWSKATKSIGGKHLISGRLLSFKKAE